MNHYRIAGHDFLLPFAIPDFEPFRHQGVEARSRRVSAPPPADLICRAVGLVGGVEREVEVWSASSGILLKVAGGRDFYIDAGGKSIVPGGDAHAFELSGLDREIVAGPALVLALALRGTWSLHASAASLGERTFAFLGESGQGKSTLAAYLSGAGWRLVADDILPVRDGDVWPRFPQLKVPNEAQPGPVLPEHMRLDILCILASASPDESPALQRLPPGEAIQGLLRHTAGTRLLNPNLLMMHLRFCSHLAGQVPAYRLIYPARQDILSRVKELLETL
jgi:hypothetical protein